MKMTHVFCFNREDNGGEALTLKTVYEKTYKNVEISQELTLNSYKNSATFDLCGAILTPKLLRELADELEQSIKEVKDKFEN